MSIWTNTFSHGLFKRPLLWVSVGLCTLLIVFMASIYGFLAVNHPLGSGILVVEAWIPAESLANSVSTFHSGNYRYLIVVGGPIQGIDSASIHPTTYADRAATTIQHFGFDTSKLIKISVPPVSSDRTLTGAEEVKRWLERSGTEVCCVDVYTVGVHARKSWILSQYVLGRRYHVGIIAGPEVSFNANHWFLSKRGTWIVVRNLAGYLYYKSWTLLRGMASSNLSPFISISSGDLVLHCRKPSPESSQILSPQRHMS